MLDFLRRLGRLSGCNRDLHPDAVGRDKNAPPIRPRSGRSLGHGQKNRRACFHVVTARFADWISRLPCRLEYVFPLFSFAVFLNKPAAGY